MAIDLSCDCGRALRIKEELAGKKIRCPECKSILKVPEKNVDVDAIALEVLAADEDAEALPSRSRRAAIQAEPPEVKPIPWVEAGDADELPEVRRRAREESPSRRRSRPVRDIRRRTPAVTFERGWFGSVNAGVAGGVLMMLIAVVWFLGGLAAGYIFFYPPILFVIGLIAIVKGGLGNN